MKIKMMKNGQTARVTAFQGADRSYRHKLMRMGLSKGTTFKLLRKAPMGDPVEIEVNGTKLTLRKAEAEIIDVQIQNSENES